MALNIQWMFRPLEIEHTTTALAIWSVSSISLLYVDWSG
jgi:hypothetical protein